MVARALPYSSRTCPRWFSISITRLNSSRDTPVWRAFGIRGMRLPRRRGGEPFRDAINHKKHLVRGAKKCVGNYDGHRCPKSTVTATKEAPASRITAVL